MINLITNLLSKNKATNVSIIELEKNIIADHIVIATCTSYKHMKHLSENIVKDLKLHDTTSSVIVSGKNTDWIIIDTGSVIIHLMSFYCRDIYKLEELYKNLKIWNTY
ncbi:MAG TPA: ribosome silencing factor [Candidatus Azoamicus sp. OHIO1]